MWYKLTTINVPKEVWTSQCFEQLMESFDEGSYHPTIIINKVKPVQSDRPRHGLYNLLFLFLQYMGKWS